MEFKAQVHTRQVLAKCLYFTYIFANCVFLKKMQGDALCESRDSKKVFFSLCIITGLSLQASDNSFKHTYFFKLLSEISTAGWHTDHRNYFGLVL